MTRPAADPGATPRHAGRSGSREPRTPGATRGSPRRPEPGEDWPSDGTDTGAATAGVAVLVVLAVALIAGMTAMLLGADGGHTADAHRADDHPAVDDKDAARDATASARVPGLGPQGNRPQFVVECTYSHSANDDPIVHPGHPGRSHLHDFFGSTLVDAYSTPADLVGGPTTCRNQLDTASYWTPALLRDGEPVEPVFSVAYYRPAWEADHTQVVAYPAGLVVLAGDPTATEPQPREIAAWHCGASPDLYAEPPACTPLAPLTARIAFPSCWDGERLDAPDHRSHMAYANGGDCPDTHPVAVPELVFEVQYPISGAPTGLTLASGSIRTLHADFMNAWDQDALEREVRTCLQAGRVCGVVSNRAIA